MALMVSVSGVRGLVGETLTPTVALQFAQAFGTLMNGGAIAVGRDTRPSGPMFAAAVSAGLLAAGCPVTDLGVVMTPTIGRAIRDGGYAGGLMITASHNPGPWNGLKFLDELGLAPDPERVTRLTQIRESGAYKQIKDDFPRITQDDGAGARHVAAVLSAVEVDRSKLRRLRVVLDSINGAGCRHTPDLLAPLGCELIHVNGEPTGRFAHPPEPIREHLESTCAVVRQTRADVGFVQDPDADRLALIDETGRYIGEEYTLALAAEAVLRQRRGPVAANLSTSRMIDDVAACYGVPVIRTPVGEAHVARATLSQHAVLGGEGNGGVIDPRIVPVRDSLSAISFVVQLMAVTGQKLSELVAALPAYEMVKLKAECSRERIAEAIELAGRAFAGERLNRSDGVRIDFADGWVHLRGSNTEPIVRIIAEARDAATVQALIARVKTAARL